MNRSVLILVARALLATRGDDPPFVTAGDNVEQRWPAWNWLLRIFAHIRDNQGRDGLRKWLSVSLKKCVGLQLLGIAAALTAGCSKPSGPMLHPPRGWTTGWISLDAAELLSETSVPGEPLRGWMSPGGSTLVVAYKTPPRPNATAKTIGDEFADQLRNTTGVESITATQVQQHGLAIAQVEAVAPGNGRAWAMNLKGASELDRYPTRMIALASPHPRATYWVVAYFPEGEPPGLRLNLEDVLKTWNPAED